MSAGRFAFCCTFLHVAVTPRYGAPCPVVFGLSSGVIYDAPATVCSALTGFFYITYSIR